MAPTNEQTQIRSLPLLRRGKTRDIYEVNSKELLMVASDRISAFDVILPNIIPGKGKILTALSRCWFSRCASIVANHLSERSVADALTDEEATEDICQRSLLVRRLKPLPYEAIVRGYLCGSGWRNYQQNNGCVSGVALPPGLKNCSRLAEAIFTPTTKSSTKDIPITFQEMASDIGLGRASEIRDKALEIYHYGADFARQRNTIIADTKFEFAYDFAGNLVLIDELFTPDSSRFWLLKTWEEGCLPSFLDKQLLRNYLTSLNWDRLPPAPRLPKSVVANIIAAYQKIERLLG